LKTKTISKIKLQNLGFSIFEALGENEYFRPQKGKARDQTFFSA
jgi:hypothetical protein